MLSSPPPGPARRLGLLALLVLALSVTAAVVAFVQGSWLGIVWVLMAGLSSNMAWYYLRRFRQRTATAGVAAAGAPVTCAAAPTTSARPATSDRPVD